MERPHSEHLLAHCPLCQVAYQSAEVRLLGERGSTRLFHCTCRSCGQAVLAVILETNGSVSSVGLVTDLEIQDALRFTNVPAVSSDECIMAHRLMEGESQAFCQRLLDKKV